MGIVKSLEMQSRAAAVIPGMTQLLSKRPDRFSQGVWPGYFRRARGVEIEDLDGNRYLDFSIGGIGATVLGYADPDVNAAVLEVVNSGSASSLNGCEEVELAYQLLELHPWAQMARFARSGGEAIAVAVRIARAATRKEVIVFCGYHGWMDWYLAANIAKKDALDSMLIPGLSPAGVPASLGGTALPFKFNDIAGFDAAISAAGDNLAGIVMEPMRNYPPTPEFIAHLEATARHLHVPLVMDEVSAGFRICSGGMHKKLGYHPDMAVFAKAIGNGYPISAVIGKAEIMSAAQDSFITSTNWTERIGPAAALATIDKFCHVNASEHLVALGQKVKAGWLAIAKECGLEIEISGIDPMAHMTFKADNNRARAYYTQEMLKRGFLAGNLFYAMYAHTFEQVDRYLEETLPVWKKIATGNYTLEGKVAESGFSRLN